MLLKIKKCLYYRSNEMKTQACGTARAVFELENEEGETCLGLWSYGWDKRDETENEMDIDNPAWKQAEWEDPASSGYQNHDAVGDKQPTLGPSTVGLDTDRRYF